MTSFSKIVLLAAVTITVLAGADYFVWSSRPAPQAISVAAARTESVVIPVKGMSCMACVAKTRQTLRSTAGVTHAAVNLESGSARVTYDPAQVTPERLVSAIQEIGYEAGTPSPSP
ncbi:hypothetical protein BH20VER1_BH20VER1_07790 [soil metagenome]